MLVQYPPSFNKYYLCSHLVSFEKLKPKLLERINGIMNGELEQRQVTGYYRREIEKEMSTRPTLDFECAAAVQWENAIAVPYAILVVVVSKVPVA